MSTQQVSIAHVGGDTGYQAFKILHIGFTLLPILFGLDKFLGLSTDWTRYLAPVVASVIPGGVFLAIVGAIEIIAGVVVWFKPRIGAYVVAAWLFGIIINLLLLPGFYDVALRDFGLLLGALVLGRLSHGHTV